MKQKATDPRSYIDKRQWTKKELKETRKVLVLLKIWKYQPNGGLINQLKANSLEPLWIRDIEHDIKEL